MKSLPNIFIDQVETVQAENLNVLLYKPVNTVHLLKIHNVYFVFLCMTCIPIISCSAYCPKF